MKKIYIFIIIIIFLIIASSLLIFYKNTSDEEIEQLAKPKQGEEVAIINTNYGEIKIRLFKEVAPIAVDNFISQVHNAYYDGKEFSHINKNNFIMLEDPIETESINTKYKDKFKDEFHEEYCHFQGAIGVAKFTGLVDGETKKINTNIFYIVTNDYIDENILEIMEDPDEDIGYSNEVVRAYKKYGGIYELDYDYTVFAQVYEGLDVIKKINELYEDISNEEEDIPLIYSIEIMNYEP